jgi:uncharacterized OB-fold protein
MILKVNAMEENIKPFREGLFRIPPSQNQEAQLIGSKCRICGKIFFPSRRVCGSCFNEDLDEVPLSRRGKLYTYTVVWSPAAGMKSPYAIGYVDLPEGVRVFSLLTEWQDMLDLDIDVELVIDKLGEDEEGNEIVVYKFRPCKGGGKIL